MAELVEEGGQKAQCVGAERWDRFSDLPDHIVYHIFSFLEFDVIARVGIVSKRCWQLFVYSPYLKLKSICSDDILDRNCGPKREQFSDSVNGLLNLRNGSELRSLCLHWLCYYGNCNLRVDLCYGWITIALGCGLQKLDLQFGKQAYEYRKPREIVEFEMPHCAFNSILLRVLKLHLNGNRLKAPAGVFPSLEELSLERMSISGNNLETWVSIACPSLKRLNVENLRVDGDMTIANHSLEELTLVVKMDRRIKAIDISAKKLLKLSVDMVSILHGAKLKINAPSINDLTWKTMEHSNISLNEFIYLQEATIYAGIGVDVRLTSEQDEVVSEQLVELLHSICHVRELEINIDALEFLFLHDLLDFDVENLMHLVVTINNHLKNCHFTILALFLMGSPNLETLSIKCKDWRDQYHYTEKLRRKAYRCYRKHQEFENLLNLDQLKEIEIEIEGKGHRLGLVENMLKIAKGLKKLTIFYPSENEEMLLRNLGPNLSSNVYLVPR